MELDDDELKFTREMYTGEIRGKDLATCTKDELRTRCAIDEQQLRRAMAIIDKLEKENETLKQKIEHSRALYEAERDCYEEFE